MFDLPKAYIGIALLSVPFAIVDATYATNAGLEVGSTLDIGGEDRIGGFATPVPGTTNRGNMSPSTLGRVSGTTDLKALADVDLVIEATSMGRSGDYPELAPSVFAGAELCYSLKYGPAAQPVYLLSRLAEAPFSDGIGMLVEQAALSFGIWTGQRPDTAPVLAEMSAATI